jgi:microcystin-dependent protein
MSSPYVGEIRMFAGNFAPAGWALCQGQLIPISENETLFNLIGTTYGGDGQSTFALPNLQGRVPVHVGPGYALAQTGGEESVTLTVNQMPSHNHLVTSQTAPGTNAKTTPAGNVLADETLGSTPNPMVYSYTGYSAGNAQVALSAKAIGSAGGGQPHDNMVPFLVINFIISLFGIFPSQS